ncbi:MAG: hypothetical protein M0T73_14840 [Deltaproteobacteria bacterium]|nr:hypothetical protein [Deltaproteobacteria bacterium]
MGLRRSGDIRGVRDIRTYSGRVDAGSVPYLAYMKISCLEMEKARREKERNSAIARMRNIDSRIHDIDAERNIILKKLEKHEDAKQALISRNDGARQRNGSVPNRSSFRSANTGGAKDKDGFKIRY